MGVRRTSYRRFPYPFEAQIHDFNTFQFVLKARINQSFFVKLNNVPTVLPPNKITLIATRINEILMLPLRVAPTEVALDQLAYGYHTAAGNYRWLCPSTRKNSSEFVRLAVVLFVQPTLGNGLSRQRIQHPGREGHGVPQSLGRG